MFCDDPPQRPPCRSHGERPSCHLQHLPARSVVEPGSGGAIGKDRQGLPRRAVDSAVPPTRQGIPHGGVRLVRSCCLHPRSDSRFPHGGIRPVDIPCGDSQRPTNRCIESRRGSSFRSGNLAAIRNVTDVWPVYGQSASNGGSCPSISASAFSAARCSASFLLLPQAEANRSPSITAAT